MFYLSSIIIQKQTLNAFSIGAFCAPLTAQILIGTLQHGVSVPDVLSAEAAFAVRQVARAHRSVPGAVRVPGQAALGAGVPVRLAAMQLHQSHAGGRTHIQGLLVGRRGTETKSST